MVDKNLIKPGEKIPDSIKIIRTDKKFDGDIRIDTHGIPLTIDEIVWNIFLIGRNDDNNPRYPNGFRYFIKHIEICFRDVTPYPEPQIRQQILKELREGN